MDGKTFEKAGEGFVVGLGWLMILSVMFMFGLIALTLLLAVISAVL